jgi:hypothetical protein
LSAKPSNIKAASFKLLAIIITGRAVPTGTPLRELKMPKVNRRHAAAGASEPTIHAALRTNENPKSRRLSRVEGRRGCHERNCVSNGSVSFITYSFQLRFYLLQAIAIPSRCRVGRNFQ